MVPVAGLEPARCRHRWILSPLRLPIPSHRQNNVTYYTLLCRKKQALFLIFRRRTGRRRLRILQPVQRPGVAGHAPEVRDRIGPVDIMDPRLLGQLADEYPIPFERAVRLVWKAARRIRVRALLAFVAAFIREKQEVLHLPAEPLVQDAAGFPKLLHSRNHSLVIERVLQVVFDAEHQHAVVPLHARAAFFHRADGRRARPRLAVLAAGVHRAHPPHLLRETDVRGIDESVLEHPCLR